MTDEEFLALVRSPRTGAARRWPVLTERQLCVVQLRADGLTFVEIGRALRITADTAYTHYRRARENVALELERRGL